jgi:hypothetical protein
MRLRKSLAYRGKHYLKACPPFMKKIEIGLAHPLLEFFETCKKLNFHFLKDKKWALRLERVFTIKVE